MKGFWSFGQKRPLSALRSGSSYAKLEGRKGGKDTDHGEFACEVSKKLHANDILD